MKKQIGIGNWIGVLILTIIAIPSIFISQFVFPTEMIIFSKESYEEFVEDSDVQTQMESVISEVVTDQILFAETDDTPPVFTRQNRFNEILEKYLPNEWVKNVIRELVDSTLDYFNFQTPYTAIELNITELKSAMLSNSNAIAGEYINALESCQGNDIPKSEDVSVWDYQACKPDAPSLETLEKLSSQNLEDKVSQLPNTVNLIGLIPDGMFMGDRGFYLYSILRWIFRLLPFITIILLIFIAYFLKENKKLMRYWCGWLLMGISGITLLAALIVLVGFKQFTGLLLNRYFSTLIAGFGNVLLNIIQVLGYKIILWVIGTAAIISLFALILLLAGKYAKVDRTPDKEPEVEEIVEAQNHKLIQPDTIEEIEERENAEETEDGG